MFLTVDILKERHACEKGISFVEKNYPNGVELSEIIQNKNLSKDFLHWGFLHLDATDEEKKIYEKVLDITNTTGYFRSEKVSDSQQIRFSSEIKNSKDVYHSKKIKNSYSVYSSNNVEDSSNVHDSSFCTNSKIILNSTNVTDSTMIVNSNCIIRSNSIIKSSFITESTCIMNSSNIESCNFLRDCRNMKNSIFCTGLEGEEYYLFNKPISKIMYENINFQFSKYITLPLRIVSTNNENLVSTQINNFSKFYENLQDDFWQWVKTLPNYNPEVLYSITFNSALLES